MVNYEVNFIVDPVLSSDEIKTTAQTYEDLLKQENYSITHKDEMGLRQLAYPINKKYSGVYFCIEFSGETGNVIPKIELALRRDERIMRFLTVKLDKFGVKYNQDKRDGKIGKAKKIEKKGSVKRTESTPAPAPTPAPRAVQEAKPVVSSEEE